METQDRPNPLTEAQKARCWDIFLLLTDKEAWPSGKEHVAEALRRCVLSAELYVTITDDLERL